ncbi:hypothetical protein SAMN06265337_0794 [Hymenobacter gelipurpurascens]|uniref:Secreted protein n=1 Tax=Hymenobacter gelipurpurascens TaxID=89968 RepID=A0A212TB61_9BACT|nr:hypothetical protein [Hymenobacter gelipurpurascens]SNC63044.1 hypothetical protein SAMN06265337_0794 [Hymenobacter gelipurpurascens]
MNFRVLTTRLLLPVVGLLLVASCRTCPMEACHTRKVHLHNGTKYHGQPWFKKQNPAIGEKIKIHNQNQSKHNNDRRKTL